MTSLVDITHPDRDLSTTHLDTTLRPTKRARSEHDLIDRLLLTFPRLAHRCDLPDDRDVTEMFGPLPADAVVFRVVRGRHAIVHGGKALSFDASDSFKMALPTIRKALGGVTVVAIAYYCVSKVDVFPETIRHAYVASLASIPTSTRLETITLPSLMLTPPPAAPSPVCNTLVIRQLLVPLPYKTPESWLAAAPRLCRELLSLLRTRRLEIEEVMLAIEVPGRRLTTLDRAIKEAVKEGLKEFVPYDEGNLDPKPAAGGHCEDMCE
jgi:hypothetical protein